MELRDDYRAAWSAVGGVVMVAFLALATLAWQAGNGTGNDVAQPAFGLFVADAVLGFYAMLAPLLHWPPYRTKAVTASAQTRTPKPAPPLRLRQASGEPKPPPPRQSVPAIHQDKDPAQHPGLDKAALQTQLRDGFAMRKSLEEGWKGAAIYGAPPSDEAIAAWRTRVRVLLDPEPLIRAEFDQPLRFTGYDVMKRAAGNHRLLEMEELLRRLDRIIKRL